MTQEQMTVHEALCEVKVADNKINTVLNRAKFCAPLKASSKSLNGKPVSEFTESAKEDFQRVTDIIKRTEAIKAALSKSNAETIITVGKKEMSVAEAIYMMQYGMNSKSTLLNVMKTQYSAAVRTVDSKNGEELEERLDKFIESNYGSKDKADPELIKQQSEIFREQNTYTLVDPIELKKEIIKLEDEINDFSTNLDAALQMSNATTTIEIEW